MTTSPSSRLLRVIFILMVIFVLGVAGYMLVAHLSLPDALYLTLAVLATLGPDTPLSGGAKLVTSVLIVVGVGALFYAFTTVVSYMIEGHLQSFLGSRRMNHQIERLSNHYIICGFGRVGATVAHECAVAAAAFVVVDSNAEALERARAAGYLCVPGDASEDAVLDSAGLQRARALLVCTDSDEDNTYITLTARVLRADIFIVARSNTQQSELKLKRAGADRILSPYVIGGHRMASFALQPTVTSFLDSALHAQSVELTARETPAHQTPALIGLSLRAARAALVDGPVLLGFQHGEQMVTSPLDTTAIAAEDMVILLGDRSALESLHLLEEP